MVPMLELGRSTANRITTRRSIALLGSLILQLTALQLLHLPVATRAEEIGFSHVSPEFEAVLNANRRHLQGTTFQVIDSKSSTGAPTAESTTESTPENLAKQLDSVADHEAALAALDDEDLRATIVVINETPTPTPTTLTETSPPSSEVEISPANPATNGTTAPTELQTSTTSGTLPTNFLLNTPFNFSYIFFIGGVCGGENGTDDSYVQVDENWYSQFVTAGNNTLNMTQDVTKILCANNSDYVYTAEFHLESLKKVEELVGDQLNETLVITVAVGMENDWSPVADLLRKGMAFFHAKEDPQNFNLTAHGLKPEEVLYFYFQWEETGSANQTGVELCRLKRGSTQLKVAKIYQSGRDGGLNYRVDMALEAFRKSCKDTEVVEVWELYSDQSSAYRTTLLFNQLPDVIMTSRDLDAADILKKAEENLKTDQYARISAMGWNNNNNYEHLVTSRKILTTVDQMVHYPNEGIWFVMDTVINITQTKGLNSTKAIQDELSLGDTLTIEAGTLAISSDSSGYLISNLLEGYDPDVAPHQLVNVATGLYEVSITEMVPFEGKFEAVVWLRQSWYDPRLVWNSFVHGGDIILDPERIWTPKLFFENSKSREDLYVAQAVINSQGMVVMESNIYAEFLCETTADLPSFPFDVYECDIELGAPKGVRLDQSYGFEVTSSDPHFKTETSYEMDTDRTEEKKEIPPPGTVDQDPAGSQGHSTAFFELRFERKPFTAWVRLIIPAILINFIGFISFWIDEVQESVALGVTAFLCSLAFRDTVELPDTADVTWTGMFPDCFAFSHSHSSFTSTHLSCSPS